MCVSEAHAAALHFVSICVLCSARSKSALSCFFPHSQPAPACHHPFHSPHSIHPLFAYPIHLSVSPFPFPQDAAVARRLLLDNQRLAAEVAASTDEALIDARAALERRERQLEAVRAQKMQLQVRSSVSEWVASLLASERRECGCACHVYRSSWANALCVVFWVVYLLLALIPFDEFPTQLAHCSSLSDYGE